MSKMSTDELLAKLNASEDVINGEIAVQLIAGETPIIQAVVQDVDEFPIMVTVGQEQITAIANLWAISEVNAEKVSELNAVLLRANLAVPLSSFSTMGDHYVIFGALSVNSGVDEVIEEITMLAGNVVDALEFCREYLGG